MHISKYIHSCLLFEHEGDRLLFNPGKFSFIEGLVSPDQFADVSTVVITHDHPDHLDTTSLKRILESSSATVIGNSEVVATLRGEGIVATEFEEGTRQVGAFTLRAVPVQHEPILSGTLPRTTTFLVNDRVLNPSDSFGDPLLEFAGIDALVLPVMAPFLTELTVVDFARRMRPHHILPVHDGYAKDFFLQQRYETYRLYFDELDIKFHALVAPGATVQI